VTRTQLCHVTRLAVVLSALAAIWLLAGPVAGGLATVALLAARVIFLVFSDKRRSAKFESARRDFLRAGYMHAEGLSEEAIERYDLLLPTLQSFERGRRPRMTRPLRVVLVNRAVLLGEAGRWTEALESINQLAALCEGSADLEGQIYLARTYLLRGFERDAAGAVDEANAECEQLFSRFQDADEASLRAVAAQGLLQKGARLSRYGRYQEALDVNARLIARYQGEADWEVLSAVGNAMGNRGREFARAGRLDEAIAEFERAVGATSSRPEADEIVCGVLVDEGEAFYSLGDPARALAAYERAIERGSDSDEERVRAKMAGALLGAGNCLKAMGRDQEALAAYDTAIGRYRDLPAAAVATTKVMTSRASVLFDLSRFEEALAACKDVRTRVMASEALARQVLDLVDWIERQCADRRDGLL